MRWSREARGRAARAPELEAVAGAHRGRRRHRRLCRGGRLLCDATARRSPAGEVREHARRIASLVLTASREYLRAVHAEPRAAARRTARGHGRVPRGRASGDRAGARDRRCAARGASGAGRARARSAGVGPFVVVELTRSFEEAADALMHSAQLLREHALARVVRSERPPGRRVAEPRPSGGRPPVRPASTSICWAIRRSRFLTRARSARRRTALARVARAGLRVPEAAVLRTSFPAEPGGT